jgi:hypothetical protein
MRAALFILAAAASFATAACNKTSTPVTATGTVLVEWDHTKASRADFAKATVGPRTAKDYTFTVSPKGAPSFQLAVHVETATVDYKEGTSDIHQLAPVAMKVTVKDNTGWELSGKCHDGPNYQMPSVGPDGGLVTPLGMSQECLISEHRRAGAVFESSWEVGTSVIAEGDGKVKAFPDTDVKID